jgi:hypothetical protein
MKLDSNLDDSWVERGRLVTCSYPIPEKLLGRRRVEHANV